LNDEDLREFIEYQSSFEEGDGSWLLNIDEVDKESYDLSVKNPNASEEEALRVPSVILEEIVTLEGECAEILANIGELVRG
jgi:type I restriction enzyme M protein